MEIAKEKVRGQRKIGIGRNLLVWYVRNRRDLPWRPPPGSSASVDPYAVLVSEFMLQQTQVATATPYFLRFMAAFTTVAKLAASTEQDVLRLWQGLGYYSRARNLRAAAKTIVEEFGGRIPCSVQDLIRLPGVGRYTAGAVASIAFGERAPILDGNVARVLCRLELIRTDPKETKTREMLWRKAEEILPAKSCGDFNSALMELGATVCTPRSPKCLVCPVRRYCRAAEAGLQETIPKPRKRAASPLLARWTICVSNGERWLIERRPDKGRWAGLWQFPTVEAGDGEAEAAVVGKQIGLAIRGLRQIGEVRHVLTHRRYVFSVFATTAVNRGKKQSEPTRRWVRLGELTRYPLSRPQMKIAEMIKPPRHQDAEEDAEKNY